MNAQSPIWAESLIKSLLKMLGIKAEDILVPLNGMRDMVTTADKRLAIIERRQLLIMQKLGIEDGQHE